MTYRILGPILITLTTVIGAANAATITVNTADNTDFSAGKTNLVYALTNINDGDTIAFSIPGAGPHYLQTPPDGYPVLIKDRVTIDGYSQSGAVRNSNPITAANNSQIKIVLDSRNGNYRDMEYPLFTLANSSPPIDNTSMATERGGYGAPERAVLGIYRATNVNVRGLAFLGTFEPGAYGIAVAHDYGLDTAVKDRLAYDAGSSRNCHINGCWLGVDPTNQTVAGLAPFQDGIAFFRHRDVSGGPRPELPNESLLVGVKAGSADPRAEFNVIAYMFYTIAGEAVRTRYSGNLVGVMPNGITPTGVPVQFGSGLEIGRYDDTEPIILGTDGDGVNDADEGNLFGPLTDGGAVFGFYSTGNKPYLISGNRFGLAVDGSRWTNSQVIFDSIAGATKVQFGSDFNGVSDAWEGNTVYNNYPIDDFLSPTVTVPPQFFVVSAGATVSFRGNTTVNNNMVPFGYVDGAGGRLAAFTNYSIPYMDPVTNSVIPTLDPTSTSGNLKGTFAYGINGYTNIIIDVYQLDQEGWNNGKNLAGAGNWSELTDGSSYSNGFAQGSQYLGSRVVPNTGSFDIDISGMGGGQVTVTVNYSLDPAGTTRGRVHTSDFAMPVNLAFIPRSAELVGLTRIVPDTLVWSHSQNFAGGGVSKIGGYVAGEQATEGTSVEATVGVLGDSTFLLAAITRATNDDANMSFTSVLVPATGGTPKLDNVFYTDAGTKWLKQINLSRQTGNPGRIGGDPRYGAVNYGGAGEISLFAYPEFNSDGRWSNPFFDDALARLCRSYGLQLHQLNPLTLASTPTSKAVDSMFGRLWTNSVATIGGQDFGRTGSSPIGLDNGNFVFVGEDRTGFNNSGGNRRAAVATIFAPNGSIVKEAFAVTPDGAGDGSMWNSVGAYRGGFFVRPAGGVIYFYDNAGNLQGTNVHNATSGLLYDLGRSDGTRMCSDIRSRYVFQAGKAPESAAFTNIMLTAYDAITRQWIANTIVSTEGNQEVTSLGATRLLDRCNLACDAYNRVVVAYRLRPDRVAFTQDQIAARIFSFDGTKFTPLTPTFFPFIQHDSDPASLAGFKSIEPSVAMTPREILFYSKGIWNGTANPTNPAVTLDNTHCYTILRHPAPIAAPRPIVTITTSGANLNLSWNPDDGLFTVQTRSSVTTGPWVNATAGNVAPPVSIPAGAGPLYVRLAR